MRPFAAAAAAVVATSAGSAAASPAAPAMHRRQDLPPAFILAGDSTTAVDGGWGDGLLATLAEPALGVNLGHSGATTKSFRDGGDWAAVTDSVAQYAGSNNVYVTISVS